MRGCGSVLPLGLGMGFPIDLGLPFPVTVVDCSGLLPKTREGGRLSRSGDFVFHTGRKSPVKCVTKGRIAPLEPCCDPVELDQIFIYFLVVLHPKRIQFGFGFSFRIIGSKIRFQDFPKLIPVEQEAGLSRKSDVWLEELQGHSSEI